MFHYLIPKEAVHYESDSCVVFELRITVVQRVVVDKKKDNVRETDDGWAVPNSIIDAHFPCFWKEDAAAWYEHDYNHVKEAE